MDKQTWRTYVESYGGEFLVWVDQSTDPELKAQNSNGVCAAMALDFVTAFQTGQPGPYKFVNGLLLAPLLAPTYTRIPAKYLEIQASLQAMQISFLNTLAKLKDELNRAKTNDKPEIEAKINKFLNDVLYTKNPGMKSYDRFIETNKAMVGMDIMNKMRDAETKNGPSYFLVEMYGTKAHAIAFGFRKDLTKGNKFPAIYEYFDANFGLFVFNSITNLIKFFNNEVWQKVYSPLFDFSEFIIVTFPAKKGIR